MLRRIKSNNAAKLPLCFYMCVAILVAAGDNLGALLDAGSAQPRTHLPRSPDMRSAIKLSLSNQTDLRTKG